MMVQYALFETQSFYWLIGFQHVITLRYDNDEEVWVMSNMFPGLLHLDASNKPELAGI